LPVTFPETIPALLRFRASRDGARVWLRWEGDSYSAADVLAISERYAVGLSERGVRKGDRVAILLGNCPEHLFTWFGANLVGAIAFPIHPASKAAEIEAHLRNTTPRVVVGPGYVAPGELGDARGAPEEVRIEPSDVAVLLGTSGTTGAPKAVMQTHGNYAMTAECFPAWLGLDARDRMLAMLPLSHVNGQAYSTMGSLGAGAELLLMTKFSASRFLADARRLGATQFNAVGAIVHILLKTEAKADDHDSPLRLAYSALALDEAQHRAFEARFGLEMRVGYGLSETTFGTIWPLGEPPRYGTMGTLRQHPRLGEINRARVVHESGRECEPDEVGELWLESPAIMAGYWNDPSQTRAAFDGKWFLTGDLVRRSADGYFTFVARKKEVLRRRGENVAAAEIEQAILSFPGVHEAAVIGIPSELGEDEIVAFVVADLAGEQALRAHLQQRLADFKVPSHFRFMAALPRTATERIAKHVLRAEWLKAT
jgi:crotonobetaine/carnitine-CoA ligase